MSIPTHLLLLLPHFLFLFLENLTFPLRNFSALIILSLPLTVSMPKLKM